MVERGVPEEPERREPIEPHVRVEVPPDDALVVVRGGPVAPEKIMEHANRQAREYSIRGMPMYSISVSVAVGRWDLPGLLAGPLRSRATYAVTTVGALREEGFALLPTYDAPHYDLLLRSAEYRDAQALLAVFGSPEPNPYKRRGSDRQ